MPDWSIITVEALPMRRSLWRSRKLGELITKLAGFTLCLALAGCSTGNYSFIHYRRQPGPNGASNIEAPPLSDQLALLYASDVAIVLRSRFTGARITREISSSLQVILAALAGAGAAFDFGESTLAVLGLGSAMIPEFQGIFNAKGRAECYQDAVRLIEEAQIEYLSLNQRPSPTELTQNGVTLFQRVTASIHVVEKTLAGSLPSIEDMRKATERMTPDGAIPTNAGAPAFNNRPASGDGGRYEGPIAGTVVRVTERSMPPVGNSLDANKLRSDIKKLDETGAKAMLEAARQYEVLRPEFELEPQGSMSARSYLFHLVDVASRRDDKQAELKAWRAIIPVRPAVTATPAPVETTLPTAKPN